MFLPVVITDYGEKIMDDILEKRPYKDFGEHVGLGHSSSGEDDFLSTYFELGYKGHIIDIGAADGVTYSNSYKFINLLGWSAVLVEPNPIFIQFLQKLYATNRNVKIIQKIVSDKHESAVLFLGKGRYAGHSTIVRDIYDKYPHQFVGGDILIGETFTLADIITKSTDILSLDCEGHDNAILQNYDFYIRPRFIIVEENCSSLLFGLDYELIMQADNYIYKDKRLV